MKKEKKGMWGTKIYAFLAVFFWASAFVSTKVLLQNGYLSPMDLGTLRYLFAGVLLLPVVCVLKLKLPEIRDVGKFIVAGLLGYTAYIFFFNTASVQITPSTASVINAICPGLTAVFAYFIFRETISRKRLLSLLLSFSGILVLCLWKGSFSINVGVLYMLAAAFCLSAYNITQRWFVQRYKAIEVMAYSLLSGSVFLVIFHASSIKILFHLECEVCLHLLYLAIFPSILSYYCWAKAMECCEYTTEVTNFMFITPVLTTILSFIIIEEFPSFSTYLGGAMILFGMILFQKK